MAINPQLRAAAQAALAGSTADDPAALAGLLDAAVRTAHAADRLANATDAAAASLAVQLAGVFVIVGWRADVESGDVAPWAIFQKPPGIEQRERGIAALEQAGSAVASADVVGLAARAIEGHVDRGATLHEARLLADALGLEDIGLGYVLRRMQRLAAEGRPLGELVPAWEQLKQYRYWDYRISDGLHTDPARELARERLEQADAFIGHVATLYPPAA